MIIPLKLNRDKLSLWYHCNVIGLISFNKMCLIFFYLTRPFIVVKSALADNEKHPNLEGTNSFFGFKGCGEPSDLSCMFRKNNFCNLIF
jgi:hypothetical protein